MRIRDVVFVVIVVFGLWFTFVPPEVAKEQGSPAFGVKKPAENVVLD